MIDQESVLEPFSQPVPVGVESFRKMCDKDYYYVDKTLLIRELLAAENENLLFTRPRRFGKTLNLDMLETFFERTNEDTSVYFRDKKIWTCGPRYTDKQGKYPVVRLSFKDVAGDTWADGLEGVQSRIRSEYERHLLCMTEPEPKDARYMDQMERFISGNLTTTQTVESLGKLTLYLNSYYGVPPVVLIDEYDAPVEEAWHNRANDPRYYEQMVALMRRLLSYGLKGNDNRSYAVLTGVQRVARASAGSGLNNLQVYGVRDEQYDEFFGFTHEEVKAMIAAYGMRDRYAEICEWYQGYRFGNVEVFNPWSVLSFIARGGQPRPYWAMVSSNQEIHEALEYANEEVIQELLQLLNRKPVHARIMDELIYPNLPSDPAAIFTLLLGAGFVTVAGNAENVGGFERQISLAIPNREVLQIYEDEILATLRRRDGTDIAPDTCRAHLRE